MQGEQVAGVKDTVNLILFWLQSSSGFTVNGEIPVWGVFLAIIGAVAAFAVLRQQMVAHEKTDDERFTNVNEMLKEIRGDVKRLLGEPHP